MVLSITTSELQVNSLLACSKMNVCRYADVVYRYNNFAMCGCIQALFQNIHLFSSLSKLLI